MTQKEMVKAYLERYGSITAMEGFNELGIVDLAGVIRNLIHDGYEINFKWIFKKNQFGHPIKFKRYLLPKVSFFQRLNNLLK